ncbi:NADH dehydrogenase (ubiquinone) complex I, assembly factor 6, partial [Blyttiomyces sp. JEL0837]
EVDLKETQYNSIADLEQYGENTASALLYLQLESLGIQDHHIDHVASHVGKANGITTLIRGTPIHVRHRKLALPLQVMAMHRISSEEIFRAQPNTPSPPALRDAIFEIATTANNHLSTARAHIRDMKASNKIPPVAITAMLSGVPCDLFLQRLEKVGFDVFDA